MTCKCYKPHMLDKEKIVLIPFAIKANRRQESIGRHGFKELTACRLRLKVSTLVTRFPFE